MDINLYPNTYRLFVGVRLWPHREPVRVPSVRQEVRYPAAQRQVQHRVSVSFCHRKRKFWIFVAFADFSVPQVNQSSSRSPKLAS
jgi:hypothetical protein